MDAAAALAWMKFFDQFKDFLVLVLIGAAALAAAIGDPKDALVIVIVIRLERGDRPVSGAPRRGDSPEQENQDAGLEVRHLCSTGHAVPSPAAGAARPADRRLPRARMLSDSTTSENVMAA